MDRRQFLGAAGAALVAAPFVSLLSPRTARAAGKAADRLIIFFSPNGTVHKFWRPTGGGAQFSFAPGTILEALTPHIADLVVCEGIDFIGVDNHEPGMANMLTGGGSAQSVGGGASVDQYIASQIGQETRFPSLEFGVQTSAWGGNRQTRMSYSGPGVYVTPEDNPVNAWKRLFGAVAMQGGGMDKVMLRRKSILDLVRSEIGDLKGRVGTAERPKLDQHLDALRKTEQGLSGGVMGCTAPGSPSGMDVYNYANLPAVGKAQLELMVTALACGLTKVASIQFAHTVAPQVLSWDPVNAHEGHHDLSHKDDSDVAGVQAFVRTERWFCEQFAYLLTLLKKTADPVRGGTLFDSSLVLWAKEMGDSRLHICKSVPFVLSGGANGWLKRGQYLKFTGAPHQKLLTSVCQGMGLSNQSFGDAGKGMGALDGIAV